MFGLVRRQKAVMWNAWPPAEVGRESGCGRVAGAQCARNEVGARGRHCASNEALWPRDPRHRPRPARYCSTVRRITVK